MITREYAAELINEAEQMNPGKWVDHSRNVARVAEKIAAECNMDSEKAYIMGLLHDIGRRFGKMTISHGLKGYNFLNELDLPEYAQISLTHSYTIQDIDVYKGIGDYTPDERQFVEEKLKSACYTDYDRLIQLCDFLGVAEGFCSIETRICDVINRVGMLTENFKNNIFKKFDIKTYFEDKYQIDIYKIISMDYNEQLIIL